MGSVVISGATSGAVTLAVPAEAGTRTLTLPAETGTVLTSVTAGTNVIPTISSATAVATTSGTAILSLRAYSRFLL